MPPNEWKSFLSFGKTGESNCIGSQQKSLLEIEIWLKRKQDANDFNKRRNLGDCFQEVQTRSIQELVYFLHVVVLDGWSSQSKNCCHRSII
jgi:hypothetical protein